MWVAIVSSHCSSWASPQGPFPHILGQVTPLRGVTMPGFQNLKPWANKWAPLQKPWTTHNNNIFTWILKLTQQTKHPNVMNTLSSSPKPWSSKRNTSQASESALKVKTRRCPVDIRLGCQLPCGSLNRSLNLSKQEVHYSFQPQISL